MRFQILRLIIWPRKHQFPPREVEFVPGKVNVITGASRTGKSAMIPIIDYCLASSDCSIPIDTIRDNSEWYGIVAETATEKLLLARRVPIGSKVSNEFFLLRGSEVSIPPRIEQANSAAEDIKLVLNTIAGTPYFRLADEREETYKSRLSFRDLMALVFQSQEVVANQNILFYKTHAHEHRERLRNWFPFILGAETIETLKARQRLAQVDFSLKRLRRELEQAKKVSDSWVQDLRGRLGIACEYGLLDVETLRSTIGAEALLELATSIVRRIPEQTAPSYDGMNETQKQLSLAEAREQELSSKIAQTRKRIADIERLKSSFVDYSGGVIRKVERLQISKWLKAVSTESQSCLLCGSDEHPTANHELDKISSALEKYELLANRATEVPGTFDREEQTLKSELTGLLEESGLLNEHFMLLRSQDEEVRRRLQTQKEMHLFLGHLRAILEVFERVSDDGGISTRIEDLEAEEARLLLVADEKSTERRVGEAASSICESMKNLLSGLDVEDKYRRSSPMFSVEDLSIRVQSSDRTWHFLAEVGSASNWVSFHLSLMCSLQEFFLSMKTSVVPSFVIFDQPSQVYFPKVKKDQLQPDDISVPDDDIVAVRMMFETLARSVAASNGNWQAIVLDHADKAVYGNVEGVVEVEEWRNGLKLIPEEWYMEDQLRF